MTNSGENDDLIRVIKAIEDLSSEMQRPPKQAWFNARALINGILVSLGALVVTATVTLPWSWYTFQTQIKENTKLINAIHTEQEKSSKRLTNHEQRIKHIEDTRFDKDAAKEFSNNIVTQIELIITRLNAEITNKINANTANLESLKGRIERIEKHE